MRAISRKIGRHPKDRDLLDLTTRRRRLQDRIDSYSTRAAQKWAVQDSTFPTALYHHPSEGNNLLSDDSADESDNPFFLHKPSGWSPESAVLILPSNLGIQQCTEQGYDASAYKEKSMRIGQANDALQGLRMALSRKAILFRGLRQATSKTKRNRSWDNIKTISESARHHVIMYLRAREALINLGATEEEKSIYRPLTQEQLKITTAIIDPALRGVRNATLPWFWTMDLQGDTEKAPDMDECESDIERLIMKIHFTFNSLPCSLAQSQSP